VNGLIRDNKYFIIILGLLIFLTYRKYMNSNSINGTWIMPVDGIITQNFKGEDHHGLDLNLAMGQSVRASHGGTIIFTGEKGVYGNTVMISHGGGIVTLYGHNSKILVKVGNVVKQGDVIALGGSSGKSNAPHCHWEIRVDGICFNPLNYINNGNENQLVKDSIKLDFNPEEYLPKNIDGI